MQTDFSLISREPEHFVSYSDITHRMIWAHSVHRIKNLLKTNTVCTSKFLDETAWNNAAFDFLKSILHTLRAGRCLETKKTEKAQQQRATSTQRCQQRVTLCRRSVKNIQ